ncbi:MAG TPA: protein kinase, partial [Pirellulales bacterium]
KAWDRTTNRQVAIKFYNHSSGDWSLLTREVEKLAFLAADRYVVQLIDVGWNADPPYYVMEYLEAGSLDQRLKAGPLPVEEAVQLFKEIATALVHAHGKGVLHCDLKPANVLLDQDDKPRLADFGQSRLSTEQKPSLGTLFFMAPEQADLKAVADARWDVYALGALMYRMIVGDAPFANDGLRERLKAARTLDERLTEYRRGIREMPMPTAHRKVSGVDRQLADIIDRCLAPNPSKRYPNAQAVLDQLQIRAQRIARQPLLMLGLVGPAAFLIVTGGLGWSAFSTVVSDTERALTKRSLESSQFAARFVAESAARDIDRRWRILEIEAAELRRLMPTLQEPRPISAGRIDELQKWIVGRRTEHQATSPSASWIIMDATGYQLARSPASDTIGKYWGYRDYFNGLGSEQDETRRDYKPLHDVHRSTIFRSGASGNFVAAFSAPILGDGLGEDGQRPVLGVLVMTVELGSFGVRAKSDPTQPRDDDAQLAVLVDLHKDWAGHEGLILQHPYLARLAAGNAAAGIDGEKPLPEVHVSNDFLGDVLTTGRESGAHLEVDSSTQDADYRDPFAALDKDYARRYIAAWEPVVVEGRKADGARHTGWLALVQEPYTAATGPVQELKEQLLRMATWAAVLFALVITGLWVFVVRVLNDTSRQGLLGRFRRQAGLTTEGTNSSSSGNTGGLSGSISGTASIQARAAEMMDRATLSQTEAEAPKDANK